MAQGGVVLSSGSQAKRRARSKPGRAALPPEVPEAADPNPPKAASEDDDVLPDEIRKMLEAAYT